MRAIQRLEAFLLAWLFTLLMLPAAFAGGVHQTAAPPSLKRTVFTGTFNRINVSGYLTVVIRGVQSAKNPSVVFSTSPAEAIQARVNHHTLYLNTLSSPTNLTRRPSVTVWMNSLKGLVVNGSANVVGTNVQSSGLRISSLGTGTIKFLGVISLNEIQQIGNSQIALRWVNSHTIYIHSCGTGSIHLAGVAKTVYARMLESSVLQATYLRTQYAQVQAKDNAVAYVCPVETLRAFASDNATIYYYKNPVNLTRHTSESGNVLQMAWHN